MRHSVCCCSEIRRGGKLVTLEGMGVLKALDSSRLGSVDSSRPVNANTGRSPTLRTTGSVDPTEILELPEDALWRQRIAN